MKITRIMFRILMIAQGLLWLVLAGISIFNQALGYQIISILMAINGLCFIVFAFMLNKKAISKFIVFGFLGINVIFTLTDQVGLYDYIVLGLSIATILLGIFYCLRCDKKGTHVQEDTSA